MMHFMDEIDPSLEQQMTRYLLKRQMTEGGWPLYTGGDLDISCSVKSYYALKLSGEDPASEPMRRARAAILSRGGAARTNVFTRICLATFQQIPWHAVPFIPVEILLLPRWFFFHLSKVSYWSRTVMVPLLILVSLRAKARNPRKIDIRELFPGPPEKEVYPVTVNSLIGRMYMWLDRMGRFLEPAIPSSLRTSAVKRAEAWCVERLNGEGGLGAIFPAMVNAYEALDLLGYPADNPLRQQAAKALKNLLVTHAEETYCQPCVSPVWDTALACHALIETGDDAVQPKVLSALQWLANRQIESPGDWQTQRQETPPGGWAFQYRNDCYPDVDDTAVVAWAMHRFNSNEFESCINKAMDWCCGMQSRNGGYGAFDADNNHLHLNEIPFADHKALLDPPTADVSARVATLLAYSAKTPDGSTLHRVIKFLRAEQDDTGAWFGRWGTNYIYGTWSVLVALQAAGISSELPCVKRAANWLKSIQQPNGGWGENNDSYLADSPQMKNYAAANQGATSYQTAWAMMGLMAAGEAHSLEAERGINYLISTQASDGSWQDPWFNAPGFPRIFYLKYHGYSSYFPLWALAQYRNAITAHGPS